MAVQKYIIDKDDIGKVIRGEEIAIMPRGNIKAFQIEVNNLKNVTNGDVIMAMFDCMVIDISNGKVYVEKIYFPFDEDWWKAPFKGGDE